MRLDKQLSKQFLDILRDGRQTGRINIDQERMDDFCHTINVINGMEYDKSLIGDYSLADYEIDDALSALILPSRVRISSEVFARDFKDMKYYQGATDFIDAKVMSPHDFKTMQASIRGSQKHQLQMKPLREARTEKVLSDVVQQATVKDGLVQSNSAFVPLILTEKFYADDAYNFEPKRMIIKWFSENLIG